MYKGMTIYVMDDYKQMSEKAASFIVAQVMLKSDSVLGLATGSTPEGMYASLINRYKAHDVDFSETTTFNLDEYYPIEARNEQSYYAYMHQRFFNHVNVPKERIHIPDGQAEDVEAFCEAYDAAINEEVIDLQILGIGSNGHIGFNEPDIRFETGTHLVTLDEETIEANARFFDSIEEVPKRALSMGIRNIMHSKKIVLVANGTGKAHAVHQMIFGDVTPQLPASILQLHNDVTVILDKEAAAEIIDKL